MKIVGGWVRGFVVAMVTVVLAGCGGGGGGGSGTEGATGSSGGSSASIETVSTSAVTAFGGEEGAVKAVLLAADSGLTLRQIVDAITAGTLQADGTIAATGARQATDRSPATLDAGFDYSLIESVKLLLAALERGYTTAQVTGAVTGSGSLTWENGAAVCTGEGNELVDPAGTADDVFSDTVDSSTPTFGSGFPRVYEGEEVIDSRFQWADGSHKTHYVTRIGYRLTLEAGGSMKRTVTSYSSTYPTPSTSVGHTETYWRHDSKGTVTNPNNNLTMSFDRNRLWWDWSHNSGDEYYSETVSDTFSGTRVQ